MNRLFCWTLSVALGLGPAQGVTACAFHGYTPNPTLIDVLLTTEQAVIARTAASDAGRYISVETLVGPDVPDIPIGVTPAIRALLVGAPSATVLLARDGSYGPWLELAVLDDGYRNFLTETLRLQSAQLFDRDQRLGLFAGLLNDPHPDIRRLALQELDRAPYSALKDVQLPDIHTLDQDIKAGDSDLMPIRILLAGLSGDRSFAHGLSTGLDAAIQDGVPYMGAYATALIELEGSAAVEDILERHLSQGGLNPETREKLLQALAIQYKTAPVATRHAIANGVADLLRDSPELENIAARQFGFQSRWPETDPQPGR